METIIQKTQTNEDLAWDKYYNSTKTYVYNESGFGKYIGEIYPNVGGSNVTAYVYENGAILEYTGRNKVSFCKFG